MWDEQENQVHVLACALITHLVSGWGAAGITRDNPNLELVEFRQPISGLACPPRQLLRAPQGAQKFTRRAVPLLDVAT
jgi:hypothetical protein